MPAPLYLCHACGQRTPLAWTFGEGFVCPDCHTDYHHLAEAERNLEWLRGVLEDRRQARSAAAEPAKRSTLHHEPIDDETRAWLAEVSLRGDTSDSVVEPVDRWLRRTRPGDF